MTKTIYAHLFLQTNLTFSIAQRKDWNWIRSIKIQSRISPIVGSQPRYRKKYRLPETVYAHWTTSIIALKSWILPFPRLSLVCDRLLTYFVFNENFYLTAQSEMNILIVNGNILFVLASNCINHCWLSIIILCQPDWDVATTLTLPTGYNCKSSLLLNTDVI